LYKDLLASCMYVGFSCQHIHSAMSVCTNSLSGWVQTPLCTCIRQGNAYVISMRAEARARSTAAGQHIHSAMSATATPLSCASTWEKQRQCQEHVLVGESCIPIMYTLPRCVCMSRYVQSHRSEHVLVGESCIPIMYTGEEKELESACTQTQCYIILSLSLSLSLSR